MNTETPPALPPGLSREYARLLTVSDGWTKVLRPHIEDLIAQRRTALDSPKHEDDDVTIARKVRRTDAEKQVLQQVLDFIEGLAAEKDE